MRQELIDLDPLVRESLASSLPGQRNSDHPDARYGNQERSVPHFGATRKAGDLLS